LGLGLSALILSLFFFVLFEKEMTAEKTDPKDMLQLECPFPF